MSRGKHSALAENRKWSQLQNRVEQLERHLATTKKALHETQKENLRLRAIEKLVESNSDVIKELEETRKELDDCQGRELVYVERLDSWARAMVSNELLLPKSIWADLAELGHFECLEGENRWTRRAWQSRGTILNRMNRGQSVGATNGAL